MKLPDLYHEQVPRFLRWLRCWGIEDNRTSFRFSWGQVCNKLGLSLSYNIYHESASFLIHILWPAIYIKLPVFITFRPGTEDYWASYGFTFFERTIHLNWRTKCKIIHLPWDWSHVRHDVFDSLGDRKSWKPTWGDKQEDDGRYIEVHQYKYVLRNGEIQNREATIYGEEMEWRWRWFRWLPYPRMIHRTISITFNDEVGEQSGSWKGGVVGCSGEWREGESMRTALRRFERETQFK